MPTTHHMTRQDNSLQDNHVMCGSLRHDVTKIRPFRRYLALADHSQEDPIPIVSCRRPPHIT